VSATSFMPSFLIKRHIVVQQNWCICPT